MSERATTKDRYGRKRAMTQEDLEFIMSRINIGADGTVRVFASKGLAGVPMGPFTYDSRRRDDPNDRIPHQHRRELRAYRLFSAWINNNDVRAQNTLDMYQGEPGEGFIRHYMIDFGSSLGSGSILPKSKKTGYEHRVDYSVMVPSIMRLGLKEPYWEANQSSEIPSIGIFESGNFDPRRWRPDLPIRALALMTDRDAFWATKIIMSFSEGAIRAVVEEGRYPEPGAAEYVVRSLRERQRKFGEIWYRRMTPLDHFEVRSREPEGDVLHFQDLAVLHGIEDGTGRSVFYTVWRDQPHARDSLVQPRTVVTDRHQVPIPVLDGGAQGSFLNIRLEVEQSGRRVGKGVVVHVHQAASRTLFITGVERLR